MEFEKRIFPMRLILLVSLLLLVASCEYRVSEHKHQECVNRIDGQVIRFDTRDPDFSVYRNSQFGPTIVFKDQISGGLMSLAKSDEPYWRCRTL